MVRIEEDRGAHTVQGGNGVCSPLPLLPLLPWYTSVMDEWAAAAAARQGFNALGRIWVVPPDRYTLDRVIRSCSRRYVFITSSTLSARNNTAPHYSLCIRAVSACVHGCMQRFPCLWDHDTNQTRIDKEIRFNESWIRWYTTTIDKGEISDLMENGIILEELLLPDSSRL